MKDEKSQTCFTLLHLMSAKPIHTRFNKTDGFTRVYAGTRYVVLFGGKNMIPFTTGFDIL